MKILIINFNLKGLEVDAFKAQAHIDAMDFRSVEGLISKSVSYTHLTLPTNREV